MVGSQPKGETPSDGLLAPGGFTATAEESTTLPSRWYHDPAVFLLETERIFHREWWYQCHESDLEQPGDYQAGQIVDQDIVILRDGDGERAWRIGSPTMPI